MLAAHWGSAGRVGERELVCVSGREGEGGGVVVDLAWFRAQEQQKGEGKEWSPVHVSKKRGDGREEAGS
jgi:hypothetical protein